MIKQPPALVECLLCAGYWADIAGVQWCAEVRGARLNIHDQIGGVPCHPIGTRVWRGCGRPLLNPSAWCGLLGAGSQLLGAEGPCGRFVRVLGTVRRNDRPSPQPHGQALRSHLWCSPREGCQPVHAPRVKWRWVGQGSGFHQREVSSVLAFHGDELARQAVFRVSQDWKCMSPTDSWLPETSVLPGLGSASCLHRDLGSREASVMIPGLRPWAVSAHVSPRLGDRHPRGLSPLRPQGNLPIPSV